MAVSIGCQVQDSDSQVFPLRQFPALPVLVCPLETGALRATSCSALRAGVPASSLTTTTTSFPTSLRQGLRIALS